MNTIIKNNAWLTRSIMEATGRFEFIKEDHELEMLNFWDIKNEAEFNIGSDWTLDRLMKWITNFYTEESIWQGEQKAQRKMRASLGLD